MGRGTHQPHSELATYLSLLPVGSFLLSRSSGYHRLGISITDSMSLGVTDLFIFFSLSHFNFGGPFASRVHLFLLDFPNQ